MAETRDREAAALMQRSQSLVEEVRALAVAIEDTVSDLYSYHDGLKTAAQTSDTTKGEPRDRD